MVPNSNTLTGLIFSCHNWPYISRCLITGLIARCLINGLIFSCLITGLKFSCLITGLVSMFYNWPYTQASRTSLTKQPSIHNGFNCVISGDIMASFKSHQYRSRSARSLEFYHGSQVLWRSHLKNLPIFKFASQVSRCSHL